MQQFNVSWTPDLSPAALLNERTYFSGLFVMGIAYGAVATLSLQCLVLLRTTNSRKTARLRWLWNGTVVFLFLCATIYAVTSDTFIGMAFVNYRNYPGGPMAFVHHFFSLPVNAAGFAFFVFANWVCDAILLWRYTVLYRGCHIPFLRWVVLGIPCAAYLGYIGLGMMLIIQTASPAGSPWESSMVNITAPYFLVSLILNISLSLAIVFRLLYFRRRTEALRQNVGANVGAQYFTIAAMLVESAMLYSVVSLLTIVPFILDNPIQNIFEVAYMDAQIISSLLIIFRVASGKAYSDSTRTEGFITSDISTHRQFRMSHLPIERGIDDPFKGNRRMNLGDIEVHIDHETISKDELTDSPIELK